MTMFQNRMSPTIFRMLVRIAFFLSILMWIPGQAETATVEEPVTLPVWSGDVPGKLADVPEEKTAEGRVFSVSTPLMFAYLLPDMRPAPAAVLICPGGGYSHLALEKEGHAVARWLNGLGIAAVVLEYRSPLTVIPSRSTTPARPSVKCAGRRRS
jgi:acetyl esterase/lipase